MGIWVPWQCLSSSAISAGRHSSGPLPEAGEKPSRTLVPEDPYNILSISSHRGCSWPSRLEGHSWRFLPFRRTVLGPAAIARFLRALRAGTPRLVVGHLAVLPQRARCVLPGPANRCHTLGTVTFN